MKNILCATDLSANSRPALRFALQLAEASGAKMHIVHVFYVLRASTWSDSLYHHYCQKAQHVLTLDLENFIKSVRYMPGTGHPEVELALHHEVDTVNGIMEYAKQISADYICVGTHGAGLVQKLIGTNTAKLIGRSRIPVISIPSHYRLKKLESILYACDMSDYESELKQIAALARPMKAAINLLHFFHESEFIPNIDLIEQTAARQADYKVEVNYQPRNPDLGLLEEIVAAVKEYKPSVLAMFTHQNRDFMERLLVPSSTKDYSFISRVPLLSFAKQLQHSAIRDKTDITTVEKAAQH